MAVVYEALRRLPEMTIICLLMTLRLMALTATWLAPSYNFAERYY